MRIAMIGTRGVPAQYGGFETAVEEVGQRLVEYGHEVVVYCRGEDRSREYLGMRRVRLPVVKHRVLETLSHTTLSVGHLLGDPTDAVVLFNAANAPLLPVIKMAGIPVAVHVDGLEWKRAKWGRFGQKYYLMNERLSAKLADVLIADAVGIGDYYRHRYGVDSAYIPYGAPILNECDEWRLRPYGLCPGSYHLVVARMEPENHVDVIVEGYRRSAARLPLVVVGSVPYPSEHESRIRRRAVTDQRISIMGAVWDQDLLNSLYVGAASYLHGHSVGGTNPSLLRAMGAGTNIIAWDVSFNREVLGGAGQFFDSPDSLAKLIEYGEDSPHMGVQFGRMAQERAASEYRWSVVAEMYELLCIRMIDRVVKMNSR